MVGQWVSGGSVSSGWSPLGSSEWYLPVSSHCCQRRPSQQRCCCRLRSGSRWVEATGSCPTSSCSQTVPYSRHRTSWRQKPPTLPGSVIGAIKYTELYPQIRMTRSTFLKGIRLDSVAEPIGQLHKGNRRLTFVACGLFPRPSRSFERNTERISSDPINVTLSRKLAACGG